MEDVLPEKLNPQEALLELWDWFTPAREHIRDEMQKVGLYYNFKIEIGIYDRLQCGPPRAMLRTTTTGELRRWGLLISLETAQDSKLYAEDLATFIARELALKELPEGVDLRIAELEAKIENWRVCYNQMVQINKLLHHSWERGNELVDALYDSWVQARDKLVDNVGK